MTFVAPQQARSNRALTRILNATEDLLKDRHFDDLAISEIAAHAQMSVGNFYARFRTKDALLAVLHERYEKERAEQLGAVMKALTSATLEQRIYAVVVAIAKLFEDRRGVLRSFIMISWRRPDAMSGNSKSRLGGLYQQFTDLLLGARDEIKHANPDEAVRFIIGVAIASCRETLVLRPKSLPASQNYSTHEFAQQVSFMMLSYLTLGKPTISSGLVDAG